MNTMRHVQGYGVAQTVLYINNSLSEFVIIPNYVFKNPLLREYYQASTSVLRFYPERYFKNKWNGQHYSMDMPQNSVLE